MGEEETFSFGDDMTALLPYLSEGFCDGCRVLLESRLQNLNVIGTLKGISLSNGENSQNSTDLCSAHTSNSEKSLPSPPPPPSPPSSPPPSSSTSSWGRLKINGHVVTSPSPALIRNTRQHTVHDPPSQVSLLGDQSDEQMRFSQVGRNKSFSYMEWVGGRKVNVLKGLELHTKVFSDVEQKNIVDFVYDLQKKGQAGKLRERTYSEPSKWKRGKGRVTLQFGCCYNYAVDKKGNPPGIIRDEDVDPLPKMFKEMIKRLVRWHVLPPTCIPNSCIVNIYDEGDCIPPHIDHHDFVRPFCTVSFLTECNILFGAHLSVIGDGEFSGPVSIPLPVGSVLILSGNGADAAKHCVPGVPSKRISITFRKMDDSKLPYQFSPDLEMQGIQPLRSVPSTKLLSPVQQVLTQNLYNGGQVLGNESGGRVTKEKNNSKSTFATTINPIINLGQDNFPPLGSLNKTKKRGS